MSLLYRKGAEGQEVKRLQRALKIKTDGKFGPKTEAAVKMFQTYSGLPSDGVVGPVTRRALRIDIYAGIDVSRWNGNVPWSQVDKRQVEFAWIKC